MRKNSTTDKIRGRWHAVAYHELRRHGVNLCQLKGKLWSTDFLRLAGGGGHRGIRGLRGKAVLPEAPIFPRNWANR